MSRQRREEKRPLVVRHNYGEERQRVVIQETPNEDLELRHDDFQTRRFEVRFGHGVRQIEDNHQIPENAALRRVVDPFFPFFAQIVVVLRRSPTAKQTDTRSCFFTSPSSSLSLEFHVYSYTFSQGKSTISSTTQATKVHTTLLFFLHSR